MLTKGAGSAVIPGLETAALNMMHRGMDDALIAEVTGLSEAKIKQLKKRAE